MNEIRKIVWTPFLVFLKKEKTIKRRRAGGEGERVRGHLHKWVNTLEEENVKLRWGYVPGMAKQWYDSLDSIDYDQIMDFVHTTIPLDTAARVISNISSQGDICLKTKKEIRTSRDNRDNCLRLARRGRASRRKADNQESRLGWESNDSILANPVGMKEILNMSNRMNHLAKELGAACPPEKSSDYHTTSTQLGKGMVQDLLQDPQREDMLKTSVRIDFTISSPTGQLQFESLRPPDASSGSSKKRLTLELSSAPEGDIFKYLKTPQQMDQEQKEGLKGTYRVNTMYKPVDKKIRPVERPLCEEYAEVFHRPPLPRDSYKTPLDAHPLEFTDGERVTMERLKSVKFGPEGWLSEEELKLLKHVLKLREKALALTRAEKGTLSRDYCPDYKIPVIEHTP